MDDSKILCIGFYDQVHIYNIEEDPLSPTFIKSLFFGDHLIVHLKLDENLLLLGLTKHFNTEQYRVLCVKNYDLILKKVIS
jgi:hypothetical protein